MTYFTIAGLQLDLGGADNLDTVIRKTRLTLARFPYVQMVVLSELAIHGVGAANAEALPSNTERTLCKLAKSLGIWLVPGSLYEKDKDQVYNTAPVINPDGEVVSRYRKMYPFLPFEKGVATGSDICVFDIPGIGRFGVSICYDMWFPETTRAMATMGAEVILHPTLTNTRDRDIECAMVRSSAAQNQCYMIDVNGAGSLGNGRSMFAGPEGDVIHESGQIEDIVVIELDLNRVRRTRENGIMGLGQPLKSFRDAAHKYHQEGLKNRADYLDTLGDLVVPERGN